MPNKNTTARNCDEISRLFPSFQAMCITVLRDIFEKYRNVKFDSLTFPKTPAEFLSGLY